MPNLEELLIRYWRREGSRRSQGPSAVKYRLMTCNERGLRIIVAYMKNETHTDFIKRTNVYDSEKLESDRCVLHVAVSVNRA